MLDTGHMRSDKDQLEQENLASEAAAPGKAKDDKKRRRKANQPSSASLFRHEARDSQRFADAMYLAKEGLSVDALQQLTGYQKSMVLNLFHASGIPLAAGRRKSSLGSYHRDPIFHMHLGLFLVLLKETAQKLGTSRLDSHTFVTAVKAAKATVNQPLLEVSADILFTLADSYAKGTTSIHTCRTCVTDYVMVGMDSGLVKKLPLGCPTCRLIGAMAGGVGAKADGAAKRLPKKLAQLNLDRPLSRFPAQTPPNTLVKAVLAMVTTPSGS